jgi:hypothetical protein
LTSPNLSSFHTNHFESPGIDWSEVRDVLKKCYIWVEGEGREEEVWGRFQRKVVQHQRRTELLEGQN